MKKIFFTLLGAALVWGCGNKTASDPETEAHHATTEHHTADMSEAIELNDGEKWQVNEEMKPFIAESETLLKAFNASESADYKTLATQLKAQNTGLIKSCTMKGKSHDELHKWLHPYMGQLEKLSDAADQEQAEQHLAEIEQSFQTYHTYFQ